MKPIPKIEIQAKDKLIPRERKKNKAITLSKTTEELINNGVSVIYFKLVDIYLNFFLLNSIPDI